MRKGLAVAATLAVGLTGTAITAPAAGGVLPLAERGDRAATQVEPAASEVHQSVEQFRGYWVDAFNPGIYDAEEVQNLVTDAEEVGANALIVQVGRRYDCFCNDSAFPRTDAFIDPAPYDPLEEVIEQAHAAGIEVHAWVNATTLWNQADPPSSPEHAYNQHGPGAEGEDRWLNQRVDGTEQVGNNTWIDPAHPGAVDYFVDGVASIMENYDVDGINLDYIRYPDHSADESQNEWGYSEVSLARFAEHTGRTDVPEPDDAEFSDWRRDQVSALVRKVFLQMYEIDPLARLSIDGITYGFGPVSHDDGFEGTRTYANVSQDFRSWLDEGIIDTVTAMNYKRNWMDDQARMFAEWNDALVEYRAGRHVVNGPALYLNEIEDSVAQAHQTIDAGFDGWSGYSYANASLTANESGSSAVKDAERQALAEALREEVFAADAAVPEMDWKTNPTDGHLSGTFLADEDGRIDGVTVTIEAVDGEAAQARTDGSGWFGAVDLAPGEYVVSATGAEPAEVTIAAGEVARVELEPAEEPTDPATALEELTVSLEDYIASGEVDGPIAHQLENALEQAQQHLAGERETPATRAMERFLRHLENPKGPDALSDAAQEDLNGQAEAILEQLQ